MLKDNLKTLRKNKGLSQEELSIKLHVVRQTISKWESGLSVPDAEMLMTISEIFETPVSEILGYKLQGQCDNLRALSLGERIRTIRKNKKITLKELGVMIGVSEQAIGQYERGERELKYKTLLLIAKALEVPVSELLNEECEENNELLRLIIDKKNLDVEVDIKEDYLFKLDEEEIEEINNKAKEIFRILLKGLL